MAIVGILAASFSLREEEPNPCNVKLADEAVRIYRELIKEGHQPVLAAQWEIGKALRKKGYIRETADGLVMEINHYPYQEIGQYDDGRYLGTKELLDEAMLLFNDMGVTQFVAVANPYIHQPYTYWLAYRKGLKLAWRDVRWIGFDKQSTQWWCRSWWQFTYQTIRLTLGMPHGHNGRQEKFS